MRASSTATAEEHDSGGGDWFLQRGFAWWGRKQRRQMAFGVTDRPVFGERNWSSHCVLTRQCNPTSGSIGLCPRRPEPDEPGRGRDRSAGRKFGVLMSVISSWGPRRNEHFPSKLSRPTHRQTHHGFCSRNPRRLTRIRWRPSFLFSILYWSPVARTGASPERGRPNCSSTDTASRDSHTQDHRVMTTGELKVESWPGGVSGSDTAAVRQNLDLLIHNGTVSPAATQENTKS